MSKSNMPTTIFEDLFSEEIWDSTYKDHADTDVNDTMWRVATGIASAEDTEELRIHWRDRFYEVLTGFHFTTGGRIYSNAGTDYKGTTLFNCFVSPRSEHDIDSLGAIIDNLKRQGKTLKSEGGWGENFSYLRPRGAFIHGIGVESPGTVKYMELFDVSSDIITSGSGLKSKNPKAKKKIRKGAMMSVLDVTHPDIIEFITAKQHAGKLSKFNISVNCTDEFMEKVVELRNLNGTLDALKQNEGEDDEISFVEKKIAETDTWNLEFPETTHEAYEAEWNGHLNQWKAKGYPVNVYNTVKVSYLWNLISESTYNRAEPGILFLDRANKLAPSNYVETISATNPCGEQMLPPGGICCLGSINVALCLNEDRTGFDLDKLRETVAVAVRFLDNVNSVSQTPLPEYDHSRDHKRRVGVGVIGWGSALYLLKTRFGSEKANSLRELMMKTIAQQAYMSSIDLAEEKGMFTYCEPMKHAEGEFINRLDLSDEYIDKLLEHGIRNSSLLSVQPTGNTSIFANVLSGGLEPVFMHEYIRTVIVNHMPDELMGVCPKWYEGEWFETDVFKIAKEGDEEILKGKGPETGITYKIDVNRGLTKEVLCEDYAVRHLKKLGEWDVDADWAATTLDLTVEDHLGDLAGFTKYIDSSCSKTINVPSDYDFESFKDVYINGYLTGTIKGLTTYRANSMTSVLSAKEEAEADDSQEEIILEDVKLPESSAAEVKVLRAENKKLYCTVSMLPDSNRPFALFVKSNYAETSLVADEAVELLLELAVSKGIPQQHIDDQTKKMAKDNNINKVARLVSLNLRHGVFIKNIVAALDKSENAIAGSFTFAIKKLLGNYVKDGEQVSGVTCQECDSDSIIYESGCYLCKQCGSSKCG